MENLYQIIKIRHVVIIFMLCMGITYGQSELVVFKYSGEPFYEVNDSIKKLTNGSSLTKNSLLTLNKNDEVFLVNYKGELLNIDQEGVYSYDSLIKRSPKEIETSFASNFFSYIWKEFTKSVAMRDEKAGVVYRGDEVVLMRFPADSIRIYVNKIHFKWDSIPHKKKDYFLFLKDMETSKIETFNTPDNFLEMDVKLPILEKGKDYQWTVAETRFLNFDKLIFYKFHVMSKEEFEEHKDDIRKLTRELKETGLSEGEIRELICEYSKFCY